MSDVKGNYLHNKRVFEDLRIGDRVQFKRSVYSHWGIYIGDGMIIHLAGEENDGIDADIKGKHVFTICGQTFDKARVCIDDFWKVVGADKAFINNCDDRWKALSPEKIVAKAKRKIGKVGYNLMYANCEHFANWCRYDMCKSDQVDNLLTGLAVAGGTALAAGLVYAVAKYAKRESSKKGTQTT